MSARNCRDARHPGGGVTGAPGRNATQVIMEDLGLDFDKVFAC
jgi:phytoene dehydrogenase-like protein